MTKKMTAVLVHQLGPDSALSIEDVERPAPGAGEVLLRVHAVGINPLDWSTRYGGALAGLLRDQLPAILGWDVSGVVEELGAGVSTLSPGDEVFGMIRLPNAGGGYAEYVAAPAAQLTAKPVTVDHVHAAAVPIVGLTAWQALFDTADLQPRQQVLIHGGAGGVGHIAVQLAKWHGARVTATASARNDRFLRQLGAGEIVDYTAQPFEQRVRDVDVVIETVGKDTLERSYGVLRREGVLVSLVDPVDEDRAAAAGVRALFMGVQHNTEQLARLAELIDEGVVRPVVQEVFPLQDVASAHQISQQRHVRGKLVLSVRD